MLNGRTGINPYRGFESPPLRSVSLFFAPRLKTRGVFFYTVRHMSVHILAHKNEEPGTQSHNTHPSRSLKLCSTAFDFVKHFSAAGPTFSHHRKTPGRLSLGAKKEDAKYGGYYLKALILNELRGHVHLKCTPISPRFGFLCHNSRLRTLAHLRRRRICRAGACVSWFVALACGAEVLPAVAVCGGGAAASWWASRASAVQVVQAVQGKALQGRKVGAGDKLPARRQTRPPRPYVFAASGAYGP